MNTNILNGLDPYMMGFNAINKANESKNLQRKVESDNVQDKELMNACKTFESYFLQMMYKSMRNTVNSSGSVIPQSNAERIFQDMLDEENSKKAAESGNGIGLAQMLYKQLSRESKDKIVL